MKTDILNKERRIVHAGHWSTCCSDWLSINYSRRSKELEENRAWARNSSALSLLVLHMRYHYEKPAIYFNRYGQTYSCNHPVYDECTLFETGIKGLAVIQQRYDPDTKMTWWSSIDPWLTDEIYLHNKFKEIFDKRADKPINGIYPTITIRQLMWGLKMRPLPRERWETCFDRKDI